jgi:phosphoribosylformimino-5-aminoimidazole carboxamide ribonucleotide (ProFAR) isomerase
MIIPSIDLQGGRTVQLVGGERLAVDAGDPAPWLRRFALAGVAETARACGAGGAGI